MKRTDQIAGMVVLSLGAYTVWQAFRLPYSAEFGRPGAGFFPLWLGLVIAILGGLLVVNATTRSGSADAPPSLATVRQLRKPSLVLLAILAAVVLLRTIGFLVTIALFLAFLFILVERMKPLAGLLTAILGSLAFYLVFEVWLKVQLPIGVLGI